MSQAVVDICCFLASQHPFAVLFLFMNPFWGIPGSLLLSPSEPVKEPLASPCQEQLVTEAGQSNFTLGQCIFFFKIYLFQFLAVVGLRCCTRAFSGCSGQGLSSLQCVGFSLHWLLLWSTGSRHVGFSSCNAWAQQVRLLGSRAPAQQLWCMGLVALIPSSI